MKVTYESRCWWCSFCIIGFFVVTVLAVCTPTAFEWLRIVVDAQHWSITLLGSVLIGGVVLLFLSTAFRIYLYVHDPRKEVMYKFVFLNSPTKRNSCFARCCWKQGKLKVNSEILRLSTTLAREIIFDCAVEVDIRTLHQLVVKVIIPLKKEVIESVISSPQEFYDAVSEQFRQRFGDVHELAKIKAMSSDFWVTFHDHQIKVGEVTQNRGSIAKRAPAWWRRINNMRPLRKLAEETH